MDSVIIVGTLRAYIVINICSKHAYIPEEYYHHKYWYPQKDFSSAVRSEHVMQVSSIINKNIDNIEAFPEGGTKGIVKKRNVMLLSLVKELSGPVDRFD